MLLVVIESPYAGNIQGNTEYARQALLDSLNRGEAPFASHLLYTQVLDDATPEQRQRGMKAGFEFYSCADLCAVYTDRGISSGMMRGIEQAEEYEVKVEYRQLYNL